VREHLNGEQLGSWRDRLEIAPPTVTDEAAEIPPISEATYGTDALTGQPLIAYGTAVINPHRYYSSDPLFRSDWFRTRQEADTARGRVTAEIERRREQLLEQQRLELCEQLYGRYYLPTRNDLGRLESWTVETEALVAEAQAAITQIEQRREEERREIEQASAVLLALREDARQLFDAYADDLSPYAYRRLEDVLDAPRHSRRSPRRPPRPARRSPPPRTS
jgi:hypothetical protein